jgi:hypothetical protein
MYGAIFNNDFDTNDEERSGWLEKFTLHKIMKILRLTELVIFDINKQRMNPYEERLNLQPSN